MTEAPTPPDPHPHGTLAVFRALRHRPFAWLWVGQTISRVGDFLFQLALTWWILEETGSAAVMGTVLVVGILPMLAFLLMGGVLVDRLHRPRLMLVSDLARGVIMVTVAWLAASGQLTVPLVVGANLLFGVVDALFAPAYVAAVPDMVPEVDLPSANALSSISMQLGRIVGPPIGALIVATGGTPAAFTINAASFFASAACLLPLVRFAQPPRPPSPRQSAWAEARAGLAFVRGVPWLLVGIAVYAWVNVALPGPYSVSIPFLVRDVRGWDVGTLGLLYAVFPVGYILGGLWLGRRTRLRRRAWLVYGGNIVAGLLLAAFALPLSLVLLAAAALVNGAALDINNVTWTTTMQQIVPAEKLGRVAAIDQIGSYALMPIGFALAGWATDQIGPQLILALGGVSTALVSMVALSSPAIRDFD
jgi:MFS family permease